ncbi:unnamed protein product, partial [Nesidiocoris tenuis]
SEYSVETFKESNKLKKFKIGSIGLRQIGNKRRSQYFHLLCKYGSKKSKWKCSWELKFFRKTSGDITRAANMAQSPTGSSASTPTGNHPYAPLQSPTPPITTTNNKYAGATTGDEDKKVKGTIMQRHVTCNMQYIRPAEEDWEYFIQYFELELKLAQIERDEDKRNLLISKLDPQLVKTLIKFFKPTSISSIKYGTLIHTISNSQRLHSYSSESNLSKKRIRTKTPKMVLTNSHDDIHQSTSTEISDQHLDLKIHQLSKFGTKVMLNIKINGKPLRMQYDPGAHHSVTDHKPLIYIFGENIALPKMTICRVSRWAVMLNEFTFTIEYIPGKRIENLMYKQGNQPDVSRRTLFCTCRSCGVRLNAPEVRIQESQRAVWKFTELSHHSEKHGVGSLRARFELSDGPADQTRIAAQFNCEGTTLSGIGFVLVGSGYRVSLVKRRFVSEPKARIKDDHNTSIYSVNMEVKILFDPLKTVEHRVRACSSQPPKAEATGFTGPRSPPMATRPTRRAPETTRPNAVCATARGSAPDSSGDGAGDTSAAATTLAPAGTHTGRDADEGPATGGGRSP